MCGGCGTTTSGYNKRKTIRTTEINSIVRRKGIKNAIKIKEINGFTAPKCTVRYNLIAAVKKNERRMIANWSLFFIRKAQG